MLFISHKDMLEGKVAVVALEGHLDSLSTPDFERYINSLIGAGIFFILLDFDNLKLISSSGIGAVLYLEKKISSSDGALVSCNLKPHIMNLFSILGFSKVLRIAESRIEAIETLDRLIELKDDNESNDIILEDNTPIPEIMKDENFFNDSSVAEDKELNEINDISNETGLTITPVTEKNSDNKIIEKTIKDENLSSIAIPIKHSIPLKPLIIECSSCNNLIKITKNGTFQCPHCTSIYTVDKVGTVIFK